MSAKKNITGITFNNLTAIKQVGKNSRGQALWLFKCLCGKEKTMLGYKVWGGHSKSCGCSRLHGLSKTLLHGVWKAMKSRCRNPRDAGYKYYGGRGIDYCTEWEDFRTFHADMIAGWQQGLSLDRIDNNRGYSKDNCRWATKKEQADNRRNSIHIKTAAGVISLADAARLYKVPYSTLFKRWRRQYDFMQLAEK